MSTQLVTSYYLKAYDAYPFDLAETEEQLNYALAYDPEHIPSLCLKSQYYLHMLNWPKEAKDAAEQAMAIDPENACAAAALMDSLIALQLYSEALNLLNYITSKSLFKPLYTYWYMFKIMELKGCLKISINYCKMLLQYVENEAQQNAIDLSLKRLKMKQKAKVKAKASKA
mgnify:FL=1|tara:strand:- start:97 stop:609 length:513 start_codon:yes stop_codon:yes gene_type:complete